MRILLVRHGESEGNIDARKYVDKGDSNVELTETGWLQALAAGKFLEKYYADSKTSKWPSIYLSSFIRPKQTFSGIHHSLKNMFEGEPKLYEDPRLVEKFFGAASHLIHHPEDLPADEQKLRQFLFALSKSTYEKDSFTAANLFGDSSKDTFVSVKSFLDGTFARDCKDGEDDFLIVCHGAVIQAFLMSWAHLPISSKENLGNPGNCDIIEISGEPRNWKFTRIYDGKNMLPFHEDALKGIKPFSFKDLPPVPDFLKYAP